MFHVLLKFDFKGYNTFYIPDTSNFKLKFGKICCYKYTKGKTCHWTKKKVNYSKSFTIFKYIKLTMRSSCIEIPSYMIERGVCYLVLSEKSFSKRLAFSYLEDLQNEFSSQYGSRLDTVSRPYSFIEFGETWRRFHILFNIDCHLKNFGNFYLVKYYFLAVADSSTFASFFSEGWNISFNIPFKVESV